MGMENRMKFFEQGKEEFYKKLLEEEQRELNAIQQSEEANSGDVYFEIIEQDDHYAIYLVYALYQDTQTPIREFLDVKNSEADAAQFIEAFKKKCTVAEIRIIKQ